MIARDMERAAIDSLAFRLAPVGLWYEDFSGVAELCQEMRSQGVVDLPALLADDEDLLYTFIKKIEVVGVNVAAAAMVGAPNPEALKGPLRDVALNEDARRSFIKQIATVWEGGDHVTIDIIGAGFDGQPIDCAVTMVAPVRDRRPDYANVLVTIQDLTAQRAAVRDRQRHVDQLTSLLDVSHVVASSLDLDEVLGNITNQLRGLVGSDESTIMLFDSDKRELTLAMRHDGFLLTDHSYEEIMSGISGWAAETRRSTLSRDVSKDDRNQGLAKLRARSFPGTSLVVSPIIAASKVMGTLTVLNGPRSDAFTEIDLAVVEAMASAAAVAINNARLYEDLQNQNTAMTEAHEALKTTQEKLVQAQKLEAIGSMASGIAHEINTPIQYVSDNLKFLQEAMKGYEQLIAKGDELLGDQATDSGAQITMKELREQLDFEFLREEAPVAIDQALEGAERVAGIVRAMKDFAHPADSDKTAFDINHAIETTLAVSRGEWKHVAQVDLELADNLPSIEALRGPLNQTLLIIIVNAAQAVADTVDSDKGLIQITTTQVDDNIEIRISDSGSGIPQDISDRIFDPFFTTKEVGEGSGQGLAIARTCIVEQHGGQIFVDTAADQTTFVIRLPIPAPTSDG
ncbi:MAG: GAF domain-containing protein [bacterium]|nr:GAF domain-containing protein [bacterium]